MSSFLVLSACEESADQLGALLLKECARLGIEPERFRGLGGARMEQEGFHSSLPVAPLAVNGFLDVPASIPHAFRARHLLGRLLHHQHCKGVVFLDAPGLHRGPWSLASHLGLPRVHLAPPQIWAWGDRRVSRYEGATVQVLFPFEEDVWRQAGVEVWRDSHPALDYLPGAPSGVGDRILLLPGSRPGQVRRNLPLYQRLAQDAVRMFPGMPVSWIAASAQCHQLISHQLQALGDTTFHVVPASDRALLANARIAACPPGTASLELALLGVPTYVVAKVDPLAWLAVGRRLDIPHLAAANLLLGAREIPESIFVRNPADKLLLGPWRELAEGPSRFQQRARRLREILRGEPFAVRLAGRIRGWLHG